ncbi:hypothetical protein BKA80DRAFT_259291 [Phyllosticta citrichinensis]
MAGKRLALVMRQVQVAHLRVAQCSSGCAGLSGTIKDSFQRPVLSLDHNRPNFVLPNFSHPGAKIENPSHQRQRGYHQRERPLHRHVNNESKTSRSIQCTETRFRGTTIAAVRHRSRGHKMASTERGEDDLCPLLGLISQLPHETQARGCKKNWAYKVARLLTPYPAHHTNVYGSVA